MQGIRAIVEKLNQVRTDLLAVTEQVSPGSWRKRSAAEKWSAAEVIAHLTMVEKAITEGTQKLVRSEPRPTPFWKRLHFPLKLEEWRFLRARTPIPLDPRLLGDKEPMLERFAAGRRKTLAFLEANRQRDLSRWRWRHPFFGSLDGYTWMECLYRHEIRHTKQLREIVQSLGGAA
ncbi:DinB family protein [Acidobacteriia bacterium AH_259_A11_L15]|nr:DinB family protein [Acidobacteriia bacterium AH_259_A11_L15]